MNIIDAMKLVDEGKVVRRASWPAIGATHPPTPGFKPTGRVVAMHDVWPTACGKHPSATGGYLVFRSTRPVSEQHHDPRWKPMHLRICDFIADDWELVDATERVDFGNSELIP